MRTSDEQRKHKRFVPEGSAFVVFRPDFRMIGPIIDISRGGLGYIIAIYVRRMRGIRPMKAIW